MVINKSKSAFKTISEVSEELCVATHVLRFWETKFYQIRPMKATRGRRYYRPDDIEILKLIKKLLYKNRYTIEGAQQLIKEKGLKNLLNEEEIQKDFFEDAVIPTGECTEISEISIMKDDTLRKISDAIERLKLLRSELSKF